ncbi:GNAT family N-acetyltransferase [Kitasatospora sp. MAA4]|uniref:GNAT family N-acetyltransferase n=1 Tax=Kitasatospora sp. MAA4 TaxID=3035093 RepID=UPI0024765445|nr:GNAT family N-acetyltransferase [Kitasatospora sp. MAA4]
MNRTLDETVPPLPAGVRPPERLDLPGGVSLHRRAPAHAGPMNAAVTRNLEHLRPWMPWAGSAPTMEESREIAQSGWQAWADGTDFLYVAGLEGEPDVIVGAFGLHGRIGPGALEIGYWVDFDHTGRGIATQAAAALTTAALELPGIHRVEIRCDESNAASAAVPRRLDYRLDRIQQDAPITAPSETGRKLIWVKEA